MSEKLFILCQDDLGNYEIRDDDKVFHFLWEVAPILNEQQSTISQLEEENKQLREEWEFSFRTEMAHHRFAEKELQEKIREKQATIDKQELRLQHLEELLKLSENLNKSYREKLIDMNLKMVIDDE